MIEEDRFSLIAVIRSNIFFLKSNRRNATAATDAKGNTAFDTKPIELNGEGIKDLLPESKFFVTQWMFIVCSFVS